MLLRRSSASHREARRLPAEVCRNSSAAIVTNKRRHTCGTAAAHYAARQLPARGGGLPGRARLPRRLPLERGREFETSGLFAEKTAKILQIRVRWGILQNNRRKFRKTMSQGSVCRKNGENSAKHALEGHFAEKMAKILQNNVSGGRFAEKTVKIPQNHVSRASLQKKWLKFCKTMSQGSVCRKIGENSAKQGFGEGRKGSGGLSLSLFPP